MTYTDRRWRHLPALLLRAALAALMPALPGCSVGPPSHLHFVREVADHSYTERTEIQPLKLPEATGPPGDVTYTLTPEVPGLSFDPHTRTLTGTPTPKSARTTRDSSRPLRTTAPPSTFRSSSTGSWDSHRAWTTSNTKRE